MASIEGQRPKNVVTVYLNGPLSVELFTIPLAYSSKIGERKSKTKLDLAIIDRQFLSELENEFISTVQREVDRLEADPRQRKLLIFPPLTPRLRFLIHRAASCLHNKHIETFSIGKGNHRRVVLSLMSSTMSRENEDANWDDLYDEDGDKVSDDIIKDLNDKLKITTNVDQVANCREDYSKFSQDEEGILSKVECGNILEIYDFSPELKTRDLFNCLSASSIKNFDIDWVDDEHALVIFGTAAQASLALNQTFGILRLRPLANASREAKLKAKRRLEKVPIRPRPETSSVLARRLVTGALGIKLDSNGEQMKLEREKLRLAKEKKVQSQKQKKDIWDGNVS